jgi:2'-5' RNA ligase
MDGVVSLLDQQHCEMIDCLRDDFKKLDIKIAACPHISYQVAEKYDVLALRQIMTQLSLDLSPFQVLTSGLGFFTGTQPILHIPVVRNRNLTEFHQQIWEALAPISSEVSHHYHPDAWMPHITLVYENLELQQLSELLSSLSDRCFNWTITLDNLSLLCDGGIEQWQMGCREKA